MVTILQRRYMVTPTLGPLRTWRLGRFRLGTVLRGSQNTVGFITWTGLGGDDNWNTSGNWGGVTPVNGDTLTFAGSTRLAPVNNIVGLTLVGLTISASAASFNITGNSISMSPGAVTTLGASAQTIALPLGITGTTPFSITPATTYSGVISGTGALTKAGAGILTLGGANSYGGGTTISAGTLRLGSSSAMPSNTLVMSGTGVLDLNSFTSSVPNIPSSATTSGITNNATGTGTGTLNLTSHVTPVSSLITDGATAKVMLRVSNGNTATDLIPVTRANTFSGGVTLAHNGSGGGTRLRISAAPTMVGTPGAITSGPWGTGVITIGEAASDQAGVLLDPASGITIMNAITFNTALGTDRIGLRLDAAGNVLSGIITANLAAATFSAGSGSVGATSITGRITGSQGLTLNNAGGSGSVTITLANVGTANDYSGDTTLVDGTSVLVLGAANQIPSGTGKGNVNVSAGAFNLGGFSDQINGLSGSGAVDGTSGTPTLTLGDNNTTSTFSGILRNTAGTLAVTKIGSGTQTFSGANTYTGATTVSAGTASITGSLSASSAVSVSGGALVGTGSVGAVTVANVASSAITGGLGTTGTLTTGALTFGGSTAKLRVNTDGASTVSLVNAAAVTLGSVTVDFNSAQNLVAGTYSVITGTSMSGTATQGTLPIGRTWTSLMFVGNNLVAVLA